MWFKEWLKLDESKLFNVDFTGQSLSQRLAQGRDIGEAFIKKQLALNGIIINSVPAHMDISQKIDGLLKGEPVQIKLRRSGRDDRNDIAYEVLRNHNSNNTLNDQLQNPHQQGRDYRGKVKHYFVMNKDETKIYHIKAEAIKQQVDSSIQELNLATGGYLKRPFTASSGTQLRPTEDRDPESFTPTKVMAFIPVANVVQNTFPIQSEQKQLIKPSGEQKQPIKPSIKGISPDDIDHANKAALEGRATFKILSTNPKRAQEKIIALQKLANANNLVLLRNPDGTISFVKKGA